MGFTMERRVVKLEDFTEADMASIAAAEVPADYADLDRELEGYAPETPRQVAETESAGTKANNQPD